MSEQELSAQEFPFSCHYLCVRRYFAEAAPEPHLKVGREESKAVRHALGKKRLFFMQRTGIFSHRKHEEDNAHGEYIRTKYGILAEVTSPVWLFSRLFLIKINMKFSVAPHPSPLKAFHIEISAKVGISYWLTATADLTTGSGDVPRLLSKSIGIFGLLSTNSLFAINT